MALFSIFADLDNFAFIGFDRDEIRTKFGSNPKVHIDLSSKPRSYKEGWQSTLKDWLKFHTGYYFLLISLFSINACAEDVSLRGVLGENVKILEQYSRVETAPLKLVAADEAIQNALKHNNRMAGYPIIGKPVTLDQKSADQVVGLLLDKNNFANLRMRCANKKLYGIRFYKEQQKIEAAIGLPCRQVFVVFPGAKGTEWWGMVMGENSAVMLLKLINAKPD